MNLVKQWESRWNSFNGAKALIHVNYWKSINEGIIPPPLMVSIDPCGICNLHCPHCNAAEILRSKDTVMTKEMIDRIVSQLVKWKTKAVCVGGGGEPLINENTYYLIDKLVDNNIETALITSGVLLNPLHLDTLLKLNYIGISVDAGTSATWQRVKGTHAHEKANFATVIKNIESITRKGLEVTYKYLLLPDNSQEVFKAAQIAKEIGCDQFHVRPASYPWFDQGKSYEYTYGARYSVSTQLDKARAELEDSSFRIFGVVQNFSAEWTVQKTFNKCSACMTTCAISPDGTITLCCDRRGDKNLELCNILEADDMWGGKRHKEIQQSINIQTCPRCTYSHINEMFEHVISVDEMRYNFF